MNRIRAIQPGQMRLRERRGRRREDESFNGWMSGDEPANANTGGLLVPGLTKTTKDAIIISQESGQNFYGSHKADPYARAHSDKQKHNDGDQYTFAFIRTESVNQEV